MGGLHPRRPAFGITLDIRIYILHARRQDQLLSNPQLALAVRCDEATVIALPHGFHPEISESNGFVPCGDVLPGRCSEIGRGL